MTNKYTEDVMHSLAHLLGWNYGAVVSKYDDNGFLWVGFECSTCGKIQGRYKTNTRAFNAASGRGEG